MSVPEPIKRPSLVKKIQEKSWEKYTRGGMARGMIQKTVTLSMFKIRVELTIRKNCATPSGCPS